MRKKENRAILDDKIKTIIHQIKFLIKEFFLFMVSLPIMYVSCLVRKFD